MNIHSVCAMIAKKVGIGEKKRMLLKKAFAQNKVNGVLMGNGTVSLQSVKMNVYCFYLDGVLIDTGPRILAKELQPFFRDLDIDEVVITHYHEDHTGCASFFEGRVPIYMNETMISDCTKKADYPLYRKVFWGKRKPFRAEPIGDTFTSRKSRWKVINTPGHTIDHLAFLNEETGQLFTGDLYCQPRTKVILREESVPTTIASIKKVLTYDFEEVYCSHAGYIKNGRDALKKKLDYLQHTEGEVLKRFAEGKTAEQIDAELFPKKYPITRFSAGEWGSIHIVRSILQSHQKFSAKSGGPSTTS